MVEQTIEKGYKKTELGVIPEDWEVKKIEEFADVTAGGTPSTFVPEYWNGNIKWMNSGELNLKKVFDVEGRITESGLKNSSTKMLPSKCVLIGLAGQGKTRGTVAINYVELCTNQSIGAILPNDSFVPEYMYNNLDSRYNELRKLSTGEGGRGGLNLTIIRNIEVPLPTKEEQTEIAKVLSDTDDLIESLDKLIEKKKNIKRGAMQELLSGKRRLSGFHNEGEIKKPRRITEAGIIPGDWDSNTLSELGSFKNGINKSKSEFGHGHPFVNLLDVFGRSDIQSIDNLGLINSNEAERSIYDLKMGDVIFVRSSVKPEGVGLTMLVTKTLPGTVFSGFLIRFRSNYLLSKSFKKYCFSSESFRKRLISSSTVSANTNINQEALKRLPLAYPNSLEEQSTIAQVLSDMDSEIESLEQKRDKYKQLKIGMMQQLLTGRIRLKWKN